MPTYVKKAIAVQADQWFANGDHPDDRVGATEVDPGYPDQTYVRQEGAVVRFFRRPDRPGDDLHARCERTWDDHGWIDTLEGGHMVCPGDWIIRGAVGELYPCKPAIFAITYTLVKE